MAYCQYYQAHVPPRTACIFVGLLRSYEHLAFDRTLNLDTCTFEFFVPIDQEKYFLACMHALEQQNLVGSLKKLPNRLQISLE